MLVWYYESLQFEPPLPELLFKSDLTFAHPGRTSPGRCRLKKPADLADSVAHQTASAMIQAWRSETSNPRVQTRKVGLFSAQQTSSFKVYTQLEICGALLQQSRVWVGTKAKSVTGLRGKSTLKTLAVTTNSEGLPGRFPINLFWDNGCAVVLWLFQLQVLAIMDKFCYGQPLEQLLTMLYTC